MIKIPNTIKIIVIPISGIYLLPHINKLDNIPPKAPINPKIDRCVPLVCSGIEFADYFKYPVTHMIHLIFFFSGKFFTFTVSWKIN